MQGEDAASLRERVSRLAQELQASQAAVAAREEEVRTLRRLGEGFMRQLEAARQAAEQQSATVQRLCQPLRLPLVRI